MACGLNLGEGPWVVAKKAVPSTVVVLLAINAPFETSASLRGGCCYSLFYYLYFILSHSFIYFCLLTSFLATVDFGLDVIMREAGSIRP